jgi:hypothetical protein
LFDKRLDIGSRSFFEIEFVEITQENSQHYDRRDQRNDPERNDVPYRRIEQHWIHRGPLYFDLKLSPVMIAQAVEALPESLEQLTIRQCSHAVFAFVDLLWNAVGQGRLSCLKELIVSSRRQACAPLLIYVAA